jgi:hypothetical protein
MVDWAAPTLVRLGCVLHAVESGWDVELLSGAWEACNSSRELADLAHRLQSSAAGGAS